ncbi:hypothetical protein I6A84_23585 [Frankia sp. CNm7]|uniref:AMIN-like domain-containing protein n=1 Tax=Frankia nepalensis TaxID=1836974 RepID=A0A937ULU1_9ACTN|nr:hypothetical protein [Frankia nepalensis]MBL7496920.1 hypothetical protein [Frankia nepalensis]MBL7508319.1 hypothetical protein [Frankia nepalensis]MBL7520989.1 hypothetical protein [Frankia nepalensis]MBL7626147.1 hypothetical protein [Frankia nepalensis]
MRKSLSNMGALLVLALGLTAGTVPARAGGPPATPVQPVLTGIHTAHAASARADLVRFRFRPLAPTDVAARYVPRSALVQDGSGLPVAVRGQSFVQVVFQGTAAHDENGRPTAPRNLFPVPGTTNVVQIRSGGDFEGVVTYFIGLRAPAPPTGVHPTVQCSGTEVTVAIPTR